MSGFFSLESTIGISKVDKQNHHNHQDQDHNDDIITPYSLYLFKNQEIYNNTKGFELWHYDHPSDRKRSTSFSSSGCCVDDLNYNPSSWNISGGGSGGGKVMSGHGGYGVAGGGSGGGGGGGMNCQDCGNQAKKDCEHMRCRTCCKSRGFHCQTHVKSTWVPAAKRRERQHQLMSLTEQQNLGNQQLSLMMRAGGSQDQNNPKRLREEHQQQPSIAVAGGSSGGGGGGGGGMGVILPTQHHNTSSGKVFFVCVYNKNIKKGRKKQTNKNPHML